MQDPELCGAAKSPSERHRSAAKPQLGAASPNGVSRRPTAELNSLAQVAAAVTNRRESMQPRPSMLSASLASFASEGFADTDEDNDEGGGDVAHTESGTGGGGGNSTESIPADVSEAAGDAEAAKRHPLELQVEMLRGKLARRNTIIEVIRRAYYHDVVVVKEELRHGKSSPQNKEAAPASSRVPHQGSEDRLSSVPSVDLRDALQLFAPAETVMQVHPCDACGGHLELVHGESKELQAARQEMARASKGEQQMRGVVHRMRTEAKEMEEVNEALQQRVKALTKENSYTLEQLQAARKAERDQKAAIATLRSKLQLAHATQDEVDRLTAEFKDTKQQLIRSNHDRDIYSASNNHLKEELGEVTKALHQAKVDRAQLESDFGATFYRLQEEIKKSKQLFEELGSHQQQLQEKTTLSDELQRSLVALKEELSTSLVRFEQTKRHLEDQLIDEERAREEMQEQNLAFRKTNKKLAKDLEALQKDPSTLLDGGGEGGGHLKGGAGGGGANQPKPGGMSAMEVKGLMRKRLDDLQFQLEWSQMRENDLLEQLRRHETAHAAAQAKPAPVRRMLSRMPSTTVITHIVANADSEAAKAMAADVSGGGLGARQKGGLARSRGSAFASSGETDSEGFDEQGDDFDDDAAPLEIDEKNFEAYHQEVHRMLTEIEEGRSKNQKQQKTLTDMERKQQALVDRLEEAKLTIETLTGSVNALKMRLNQDSAGAAEELEDMLRQLEEGKRDQLYEAEKTLVLKEALRSISERVFEFCDNQLLKAEIVVDFPTFDEEPSGSAASAYGSKGPDDPGDLHLVPDLYRKKQELRRKVMMEKEMKKFSQVCHSRSEIVNLEMRKLRDVLERMREELDEAENKIDSDQLQLRTLEAEIAKLRLTVEMGKNNLQRSEKALKATTEDLQDSQKRSESFMRDLDSLRVEHAKLQEDQKRLTMMLFEKTKAWEKEISANDKERVVWSSAVGVRSSNLKITTLEAHLLTMTAARDSLHSKLQDIEELADFRRRTNRSVTVSAVPEVTESEMQTDRWKPHGLILRQRNSPDSMPQRFLGKASVMVACPEFASSSPAPCSVNQESGALALLSDVDEHRRELLELTMYPSAKAGGRQIKTSHGSSRPKALSKLFLSSDGISQKYISPTPRQAFPNGASVAPSALQDAHRARPFTSQG